MNKYTKTFYDSVSNRAVKSAEVATGVIKGTIKPNSVVDIGSGQGIWLCKIVEMFPTIMRAVALDLQPHESPHFDQLKNLSLDFQFVEINFEYSSKLIDEEFDIAICLEVLEHLTSNTAVEVAKEIGRKCSYLIFSAAISGQGGTGHINERSFKYWMELMQDQGFIALDVFRPALRKFNNVPRYYKHNMMLFWHPENSYRRGIKIDLETLLARNNLEVFDIRDIPTKIRHALVNLIPSTIITAIVKVLDNTIRRLTQR